MEKKLFVLALLAPACIDEPELSEATQDVDIIKIDPIKLCLPATPVFGPLSVTVPLTGKILSHAPIHYTTGNIVDVAFHLPSCTGVSEVKYGNTVLGTSGGGIDAPSAWYEVLSDTVVRTGGHITTVRLHLSSSVAAGGAGTVRFTAKSAMGTATATAEMTLSRVKDIGGQASFSISEAELHNGVVSGVYSQFRDDGDYTHAASGRSFYDPVYSSTYLRIEPDGIRFNQRFAMSVTGCDPVINASGRFHLEPGGSGVNVVWDSGPSASTDFGTLCSIATLGIPQIVAAFVDPPVDDIKERVQKMVDDALVATGCSDDCVSQIDSFEMRTDELRVHLALPLERIQIEVPYNTTYTDSPFATGVPLRSGDQVLALPAGVPNVCKAAGAATTSTCEKARVAPGGLFNFTMNAPVPNPWVLSGTVYAYHEERDHARDQLVGLTRDPARLPLPSENAAMLLARRGNATTNSMRGIVASPCRIDARAGGQDRVAFSANDYRAPSGHEYGTGSYVITLEFLPSPLANNVSSCF